ncbi:MAG TPA: pyridoxamine 5'-phosphate oxidase family protein [Myxococcota bacterium]|nr:pyridoxamine 5'-phosphate oxidase family protein [Myxococcota bacterium]
MNWDEFANQAPELAQRGFERIEASGMVLLGTLRPNGFPRISPCEVLFLDGEAMLGMMWRSPKALDLLRDPRCVLHSTVSKTDGSEGDFKLYGRAVDVRDLGVRKRYCEALFAKTGWQPTEREFHLFVVDVEAAGFMQFGGGKKLREAWKRS